MSPPMPRNPAEVDAFVAAAKTLCRSASEVVEGFAAMGHPYYSRLSTTIDALDRALNAFDAYQEGVR
jgi:hypothetical protein